MDKEIVTQDSAAYANTLPPPEDIRTGTAPMVGTEQIREWDRILTQYKSGKAKLERRVQDAERWWKLRNQFPEERDRKSVV